MLKNVSAGNVAIRYDGRDVTIPPGYTFDPCEVFNRTPAERSQFEAFFLSKHAGLLERVESETTGTPGVRPAEPLTEQPPQFPDAAETEAPAAAAGEPEKPLTDMKIDELRKYLADSGIIEGWDGDTKKADLLKLAQTVKKG